VSDRSPSGFVLTTAACSSGGSTAPGDVDGGGDDGAKTWTKGEVWKFFTQFE